MPFVERAIGYLIKTVPALPHVVAGQGAQQAGLWVNRIDPEHLSCVVVVVGRFNNLPDGETATVAVAINDALDAAGAGSATYAVQPSEPPVVSVTNDTGAAANIDFAAEFDVDLSGAREFIQSLVDVTSTVAADFSAIIVLGGSRHRPA